MSLYTALECTPIKHRLEFGLEIWNQSKNDFYIRLLLTSFDESFTVNHKLQCVFDLTHGNHIKGYGANHADQNENADADIKH